MNNIKTFREQKGWTLKDLAERAGMPLPTVATYERGREPKLGAARKVAKALRKPMDSVFPIAEG